MNKAIPYQFFGSNDLEKCIFLHGNGFPPNSYQSFLDQLGKKLAVYAMYQRPFWETDIKPNEINGWNVFKNELEMLLINPPLVIRFPFVYIYLRKASDRRFREKEPKHFTYV